MFLVKKHIRNLIDSFFRNKNKDLFYGDFLAGAGNRFELFLLDLLNKDYLRYLKYRKKRKITLREQSSLKFKAYQKSLSDLNENGVTIITGFFANEADDILSNYSEFFNEYKKNNKDYKRLFSLRLDPLLFRKLLSDDLVSLLCDYKKTQLYLRSSPGLNITYPGFNDITTHDMKISQNNETDFANFFHLDTPHLVQYHILLKDIDINDPHMLYAKKSHKHYFGMRYRIATEEYVRRNYEIGHCIGPKGTVYLFDGGSGMHRLFSTKEGFRMTMDFMFTPGNSILKDSYPIQNIEDFKNLSNLQEESIKYLR